MSLVLPSPAKLNLYLSITGRREDGYHNLQTHFQFLELSDEIQFMPLKEHDTVLLTVSPDIREVPADENNLIIRAARLPQHHSGCHYGAQISLLKKLPVGGGVGGGSSNAATTLVGLNHLWKAGLLQSELVDLGRTLGADVPIFVHGYSAFAEGVGDVLVSTPNIPELWYVLIAPHLQVNTSLAFQHPRLPRNSPKIKAKDAMKSLGRNDFENVIREVYPEIDNLMNAASNFGSPCLTGCGSCVFLAFDALKEAEDVKESLSRKEWDIFVTKGCNQSPLYRKLQLYI